MQAMAEWLAHNAVWAWVILGLALLLLEIVLPGIFLVWFGAASLATALLVQLLAPLSPVFGLWQDQLILFIILSIALILKAHKYFVRGKRHKTPFMNEKTAALLGQTFPLRTAIDDNGGTIRAHDTVWRVKGKNLPQGSLVRLKSFHAGVFTVEEVKNDKS